MAAKKSTEEKNAEYWKGRFLQLEETEHQAAGKIAAEAEKIFAGAKAELEKQIAIWFDRIAVNNQVSLSEAKRLLKADELKEFKWSLEEYIKAGRESNVNGSWIRELENASAKFHITRLRAMEMDIQNTVETLYAKEQRLAGDMAKKAYMDGYYRTAFEIQKGIGVGWDIAAIDRTALEKALQRPWTADGVNFSDRIWTNKDKLFNELRATLSRNIMLGRPPGDCIKDFAKKMDVSEKNAATLIYTESAYFSAVSRGDCYRELGVDRFFFVATLDERTSDICREMDGKVFDMKDYEPGVNAEPMHPRCRSTTAPYFDDMADLIERAYRDPETGKTRHTTRNMNYREWHDTYVKNEDS